MSWTAEKIGSAADRETWSGIPATLVILEGKLPPLMSFICIWEEFTCACPAPQIRRSDYSLN
jgi:hypothetical protein